MDVSTQSKDIMHRLSRFEIVYLSNSIKFEISTYFGFLVYSLSQSSDILFP